MICGTCGRDNPKHLVFCQECGQKLAARVAPPTPPVGLVPAIVPRPAPSHASSPMAASLGPAPAMASMSNGPSREIAPLGTTQAATPFGATALADAPIAPAQGPSARPSAPDFSFAPRNASAANASAAPAKVACPRCSAWNEVGLRFCVTCGGSLETRTAPVPPNAAAIAQASAPLITPVASASAIAGAIAPARVVSLAAPQAPETVRVCARCRGVCDATAQFCRFCGASLGDSPPIPSSALPSSAPPTPRDRDPAASAAASLAAPITDPIPPPLSREAQAPQPSRPDSSELAVIPHISTRPTAPTADSLAGARAIALSRALTDTRESANDAAPITTIEPARIEPARIEPAETSASARAPALNETSLLHGSYAPAVVVTDVTPRARLVVIAKDGGEGPSYPIGESMDIGRAEGHMTIPEDRYLSPRHARIVRSTSVPGANGATRLVLRDLSSTNGVYVRIRAATSAGSASPGNPAHAASDLTATTQTSQPTHPLADQDLFLVGQQVLRFEIVSDAIGEGGLGPASQHGTLLFGTPAAPRYARLSQRTVEGVSRDVFYIRKAETVLGRESGDIVFTEDPFLSRRHAAVRMEGPAQDGRRRFLLADLGSSNGTFVQIRGEVVLQSGDQFRIGQQLFRIDIA